MTYIYEFNSVEWWLKYNQELDVYIKAFKDNNPDMTIEKRLAVGENGLVITVNIEDKNENKGRKQNEDE